jgi:predicted transcriptional regulator of viral defense system
MGYFTAAQARECGFSRPLLSRHARSGRFIRVRQGLYRLRDYPSSSNEDVMAAWLSVGKGGAVVSHESALDLLELSDVIPNAIHITVPRSRRYLTPVPGVRVHTSSRPFGLRDVVTRQGMRITSPTRSILDSAQDLTAPEQIEMAIRQAADRGQLDPERLRAASQAYDRRVRDLVDLALRRRAS